MLVTDIPERPKHLPDFEAPPLNEVMLGVQFAVPENYRQIMAGEVWNLFRDKYPRVRELPALPPVFETFGRPSSLSLPSQFSLAAGVIHPRFWFSRDDGEEIIQFQPDKLLHNWCKSGNDSNAYPHFELISLRFKDELTELQHYMESLAPQALSINQCEIGYVNHIRFDAAKGDDLSTWLRFLDFPKDFPDSFAISFSEVLNDRDPPSPWGRLYIEASLIHLSGGIRVIVLALTVKGAPLQPDIDSALDFLARGRKVIVQRFAELTTDKAHEIWRRVK
jgi:uncharacterized protein (TIGR04255 family)